MGIEGEMVIPVKSVKETKEEEGRGRKMIIGICDDNPMAIQQLRKMTEGYLEKEGREAVIVTYSRGTEVLEAEQKPDILFLDIEMPGGDGIQTGKRLREGGCDCRIIMATSMAERFKEGYHIGAVRFVTKPFDQGEVWEALSHALGGFIGKNIVELYENRILHKVEEKQIHFIKAYDGYAEAVVGSKGVKMRTEKSLSGLERSLDKRLFYRVSREYLVNFAFIEAYQKGIILIGGQRVSVSRRNRKEFERAYREYDLHFGG